MKVFKVKSFSRFAKAEGISDQSLAEAILQAERGLADADLGGGLIKLRVARPGQGKRGGYRTLIAYRARSRAVFLFGFAKSERDNISADQLADLKVTAAALMKRSENEIDADIEQERLQEVDYEEENER